MRSEHLFGGVQPLIANAESYGEEQQYGDYLCYQTVDEDEDGTYDYVEITDCVYFATEIVIPSEIEGLPVTSIGSYAFYDCYSLESIEIPNSVTSIGDSAFDFCESLESINVSEDNNYYSSVDGVLFNKEQTELITYPCGKTGTSYTIPDSVTSIGYFAFFDCESLESIEIPNSVTSIGSYAFCYCESLESIEIPDGVTSIGDYAFYYCKSLESINVSEDNNYYSSVDGVLFNKEQTELITYLCGKTGTSYTIPDSVTSIGDRAFYYCESLASIEIPNSVTSIGHYAFFYCTSLASIEIPNSVTSIGYFAFFDCESLESVEIPNSVTSIGDLAFSECDSLESINVSEDNNYYSSVDGVLFNKEQTELITYPCGKTGTSYTIPDSVTSIGYFAFFDCESLESVEIPNSVTSIGDCAFSHCTSLESITIENPDCEIYDSEYTIYNGYDDNDDCYFNGTIYGYENSTAQSYAGKYGYNFESLGEKPVVTTPAETTTITTTTTTTTTTVATTIDTTNTTTNAGTTISIITTTDVTTINTGTTTTITTTTIEKVGDANGDGELNVRDCAFIARLLSEGRKDELPVSADYNGDGEINVRDVSMIARYLANKKS